MVASERRSQTIYPPPAEVFSAFNLTPFDKVKAVVIGQDPYHGPGQGHGLSFSVKVSQFYVFSYGTTPPCSLLALSLSLLYYSPE